MIISLLALIILCTPSVQAFKIKNNSGFKTTLSVINHRTEQPILTNIPICRGAIVGFEPTETLPHGAYALRVHIDDKKSLPLLANHIELTKDTMFLIDLTKHERPVLFNCAKTRIKKCRRIGKHKKTGSVEIIPDTPFKQVAYQEVLFVEV